MVKGTRTGFSPQFLAQMLTQIHFRTRLIIKKHLIHPHRSFPEFTPHQSFHHQTFTTSHLSFNPSPPHLHGL